MKNYRVTFSVDATVTIEVDAESPEEAKTLAFEKVEAPSLCHHCAHSVDMGDVLEDPCWVDSDS